MSNILNKTEIANQNPFVVVHNINTSIAYCRLKEAAGIEPGYCEPMLPTIRVVHTINGIPTIVLAAPVIVDTRILSCALCTEKPQI